MRRISYLKEEWFVFANKIKTRDDFKCMKCHRTEQQVVLQVHHTEYIRGREPWEYPMSSCQTLCKGCHAVTHNILEPNYGWTLLEVSDSGESESVCERSNCGSPIRYEHLIYRPDYGYRTVGSTCVEFLTEEEKVLSKETIKIMKNLYKFVKKNQWHSGITQNGNEYEETKYKSHRIRIYGTSNNLAYQLVVDKEWQKTVQVKDKDLSVVQEIAYIALKMALSDDKEKYEILSNLHKNLLRI